MKDDETTIRAQVQLIADEQGEFTIRSVTEEAESQGLFGNIDTDTGNMATYMYASASSRSVFFDASNYSYFEGGTSGHLYDIATDTGNIATYLYSSGAGKSVVEFLYNSGSGYLYDSELHLSNIDIDTGNIATYMYASASSRSVFFDASNYSYFEGGTSGHLYDISQDTGRTALGTQVPNLDNDGQSFTRAHVLKGAAGNAIAGATAFTAGATIEIVGLDTAVYVGADGAQAILNTVGRPAGVPIRFTLGAAATTFYIDAATGGIVIGHQVS